MDENILLDVRSLSVDYTLKGRKKLSAVADVSLQVRQGETLALVGESGCGKSTLGRAMLRLVPPSGGQILFRGERIDTLSGKALLPYRRQMQMIFQDPYACLDPRMTVRDIIAEPLQTYKLCPTREAVTARVAELLDAVGLDSSCLYRYAHQFSGGQRQRIGIARAIALTPSFIVCDEPVSALDVSVQNQILNLMKHIKQEYGLTYFFISHDLSVVRFIADRVCVMFLGRLCETGDTETIYNDPLHPYTKFLLDAIPKTDPGQSAAARLLLSGELPSPVAPPSGCRFHTRCPYATEKCSQIDPALRSVRGRQVACHLYDD